MNENDLLKDKIEKEKEQVQIYEDYLYNQEVHLIDHFPDYFKENDQIVAICNAADPEFNLFRQRAKRSLSNQIVGTSDEAGVSSFEDMVGILHDTTMPLEERKAQVLARMNERLPYTEIRLQRMLAAIVGWNNFKYERHGAFVRVHLLHEGINGIFPVNDLLERILPMNLHFEVDYLIEYSSERMNILAPSTETKIIDAGV